MHWNVQIDFVKIHSLLAFYSCLNECKLHATWNKWLRWKSDNSSFQCCNNNKNNKFVSNYSFPDWMAIATEKKKKEQWSWSSWMKLDFHFLSLSLYLPFHSILKGNPIGMSFISIGWETHVHDQVIKWMRYFKLKFVLVVFIDKIARVVLIIQMRHSKKRNSLEFHVPSLHDDLR